MIIQKSIIEKMIERADEKAEQAYQNYQATGERRFDTARRREEDLADTLRMALSAYDDHTKLIALKADLLSVGGDAHDALRSQDQDAEERVLRQVVAIAKACAGLHVEELTRA